MNTSDDVEASDPWDERLIHWRRKLGRLRLDAEPVEEQVERLRRVTWVLTAVPAGLGLFMFTLFTAFGRPDIGLGVVLVLLAPLVGLAWLDFKRLERNARAYLEERREWERRRPPAAPAD